jgi:hypothetical protein
MKKPTLKHLSSSGQLDTRTTARDYSHVVICVANVEVDTAARTAEYGKAIAKAEREGHAKWADELRASLARQIAELESLRDVHWVGSWSSRLDLAQREADRLNVRWAGARRFYVEAINNGVRP